MKNRVRVGRAHQRFRAQRAKPQNAALFNPCQHLSSFGFAHSQPDSVYTRLNLDSQTANGLNGNCFNVVYEGDEGHYAKYLCDRVGGFSLFFEENLHGEWLSVSLGHHNVQLPFGDLHFTHFTTLPARTAEWRGVYAENGVFEPFALIVRTLSPVLYGDGQDGKTLEMLSVVKLSRAKDGICIIGSVVTKYNSNANAIAREMADALQKPLADSDAVQAQCIAVR